LEPHQGVLKQLYPKKGEKIFSKRKGLSPIGAHKKIKKGFKKKERFFLCPFGVLKT